MKSSAEVEDGDLAANPAGLNFDNLDQFLGFHVRQAQGTMHRRVITVLAKVELTQKHAATLWLIGANPGTSQIALGGALRMDRATTMAVIDKLEGRALVVRQRSVVDRRRHELFLTPAGQKMLVKVKSLITEHERQFSERFTPEELETLVSLLKRIYL